MCGAPIVLNALQDAAPEEQLSFTHSVKIMTAAAPPPPSTLQAMQEMGFEVSRGALGVSCLGGLGSGGVGCGVWGCGVWGARGVWGFFGVVADSTPRICEISRSRPPPLARSAQTLNPKV